MKKRLLLILMAMTLVVGCSNKDNSDSPKNREEKKVSESNAEVKDSNKSSDEKLAGEDLVKKLQEDNKYLASLEAFQDQFLEYAALCMVYPDSYGFLGYDEQMKVELIAFSEGMGRVEDAKGAEYRDNGYFILADRVNELSDRYFGKPLDKSMLTVVDGSTFEIYSNESNERAFLTTDGEIMVGLGDWGTAGPKKENTQINIEENGIEVITTIGWYDFEISTDVPQYELGTYTITYSYNADDPYEYKITGFAVNVNENRSSEKTTSIDPELIVDAYMNMYNPEGTYVIFDTETIETDSEIIFTLRYQPSDREEEEMIENGTGPLANIYVTQVSVNKSTGVATNDNGEVIDY